jgi:hypothetical protein
MVQIKPLCMVVYSRIYQLLLHISIVPTCAEFLLSPLSPLLSQVTHYTIHRLLSQSYGTPQGTDFNRCTWTRPSEVLKGCPVCWLHTVIRRRSSVQPDVSQNIIVLYRILVLYYSAFCDTKPLSYPQARAWNCARCMKLHARKRIKWNKMMYGGKNKHPRFQDERWEC